MSTEQGTERAPVVLGPGEGRRYDGGRVQATFKADGAESANRYAISEWWLEPHTRGPGEHHHPDDDVFYVLEGTFHVRVAGQWHEAPAGSFVAIPGGVRHDFENRGDVPAGMLNVSAPGGFEQNLPGIAAWFKARPDEDADV